MDSRLRGNDIPAFSPGSAVKRIMQSKRQIQQMLGSAGITANRYFGQHFLIDLNLMRLLIKSANINKDDIVLERRNSKKTTQRPKERRNHKHRHPRKQT
jgi:hypothetical protein